MKYLLLCLLLPACSMVPTPGGRYAALMGGKGSLVYNADGSMSFIYDNEVSFQHATQLVGAAVMSKFAFKTQESNNAVSTVTEKGKAAVNLKKTVDPQAIPGAAQGQALIKGTLDPNIIPK